MDLSKTQPRVTIAGKEYTVRYKLSDAEPIEALAAAPGRSFMEMAVGTYREKVAIIWGGLKHAKNTGTRTVLDVVALLDEHQEKGGNWIRDVFNPCVAAALYSGLGGDVDPDGVDALIRMFRRASGEEAPDDSGKAVKAAE